jgi:hypothetical protein
MGFFDNLLEYWINFVALPMYLTENSPSRPVRWIGAALLFPWFVGLACIGPLVLGSAVICLFGALIEDVFWSDR